MSTTDAPTIREKTLRLINTLGPTLTLFTIAEPHKAMVDTWTNGCCSPDPQKRARIEKALELLDRVTAVESEAVARSWFLGDNTSVAIGNSWQTMSPAAAIRSDHFDEATASAQHMIDDSWS